MAIQILNFPSIISIIPFDFELPHLMQTVIGISKVQDKVTFVGVVTVSINGKKMSNFFAGVGYLHCDTFALMNGADNEIKQHMRPGFSHRNHFSSDLGLIIRKIIT